VAALAHAAEMGRALARFRSACSLRLASRSPASDCDHMCNPSSFVSSFWLVMAWGVISLCIAVAVFHNIRSVIAICSETPDCSCRSNILDRKSPLRVLRRIDLRYTCSNPFQPVKHCLKSAHESLTGLLNSYHFRCDMDSSISNDAP
jgi:hypothetical protein